MVKRGVYTDGIVKLVRRGSQLVAVPLIPMPTLTTEMVREVLERVRR